MTLDASGRLMVGTTSPVSSGITVTGGYWSRSADLGTVGGVAPSNGGIVDVSSFNGSGGTITFTTANTSGSNTERARIDSSGNLLVGRTAQVSGERFVVEGNVQGWLTRFRNTQTNGAAATQGLEIVYTALSPNDANNPFLFCVDSTALRMSVRSNGGIANFSGNNVNLSDRREKTNFAPAGEYLSKICAIPVQTFNYIDQNMEEDPGLTLGVVAQDVQAVAPELVMESNWAKPDEEPKMRLSIYQTDLQYALMKCIQEQQALIDAQQAALQTLTARVAALESN
jgi:hypothetical protein